MTLPQLTLRDLFWLVALVAVGCGWWVDHTRPRPAPSALPPAGRYQMLYDNNGRVTVFDTATAETWYKPLQQKWQHKKAPWDQ